MEFTFPNLNGTLFNKTYCEWLDIKITYNRVGKPSAKLNDEHFEISISHHGEYVVAVAIGAHNDV